MPPMIKSPSKPHKPSENAKLASNAPPLPPIKLESKSSNLKKCGRVPMEPSEISSMELFSDSPLSSKTSLDLFLDGKNLSSLADTPLEINTRLQTSLSTNLERLKLFSKETMVQRRRCKFINSKDTVELVWVCITLMKVLNNLLIVVSNLLYKESILFT